MKPNNDQKCLNLKFENLVIFTWYVASSWVRATARDLGYNTSSKHELGREHCEGTSTVTKMKIFFSSVELLRHSRLPIFGT